MTYSDFQMSGCGGEPVEKLELLWFSRVGHGTDIFSEKKKEKGNGKVSRRSGPNFWVSDQVIYLAQFRAELK